MRPVERMEPDPASGSHRAGAFRLSIRIGLVAAFTMLLLLATAPIAVFTHGRITALAETEAADQVRRVAEEASLRVSMMFDPLAGAIDLMRHDPVVTATSDAERDARIPAFIAVLASEPRIVAFYVARDSGDMLLVRKGAAALPGAPAQAHFAVQSIAASTGSPSERIRFFTAAGTALPGERSATRGDYDPRERPWYGAAKAASGTARMEPYRFQSLDVLGVTLARAAPAGDAVIAGDVTLEGLRDFLRERKPSPGAALLLLDGSGRVIAATDDAATPGLLEARVRGAGEAEGRAAGTEWRTAWSPVRIGDEAAAWRIVVAVPRSEVLAPADALRDALLRFIPIAVAAAGLLVLLLSARIAGPVLALEAAARRICRNDFTPSGAARSPFSEIDRLNRAIETMRSALATFMRYVPADIVRELIASGREAEIEGTRREITVVFSDLRDFTSITEKLPPATVTELLSAYYDRMTRLYKSRNGVVDKFMGDGIMALWNAPASNEDHVADACRACLAARDAFAASPLAVPGDGRSFVTRFGVHTGEAVIGNVGGEERMQFTAVGATVNLASRIERLNKLYDTDILVSEAVFRKAGDRFVFRRIDDVRIPGISEPARLYVLIGERVR
jgi:adenylate cyclase